MGARKGTHVFQFGWTMGATFLGLAVPDLSLRDLGGTKVTTTVVDGGGEGPIGLERRGRTGRALGRDEAGKKGGGGEGGKRTHLCRAGDQRRRGVYKALLEHMERIANVCAGKRKTRLACSLMMVVRDLHTYAFQEYTMYNYTSYATLADVHAYR